MKKIILSQLLIVCCMPILHAESTAQAEFKKVMVNEWKDHGS